jgi:hypothetical protein
MSLLLHELLILVLVVLFCGVALVVLGSWCAAERKETGVKGNADELSDDPAEAFSRAQANLQTALKIIDQSAHTASALMAMRLRACVQGAMKELGMQEERTGASG